MTNSASNILHLDTTIAKPAAKSVFTIIGVGASAGGLEALSQMLGKVQTDCNLAFVVVQHVDPDQPDSMLELLSNSTQLPVVRIVDGMQIEAAHVYLIPPQHELSILHGRLFLFEPVAARGHRTPIDNFLRSLATDQQANAVGVILSGMGNDGSLGVQAIKERGGIVAVQEPQSAKFSGMPTSAIATQLVDLIAPAQELVARIDAYVQQKYAPLSELGELQELEKVILSLRQQSGHDFSLYKKSTISRRIERRMALHMLPKMADYVRYLRDVPQEAELLVKELLIGVTSFFRDPKMWDELKNEVLPALLSQRPQGGTLRAWCTACSTGEEAYSLAIVFREALAQIKPSVRFNLQIFATDLDKNAIDKARAGVFTAAIAESVSQERLQHFFVQQENGYRINKEVREMVIFAPQNLLLDPPFTKLDILSCRNLMIYLEASLQKKVLPLLHYSLNPGGILILGQAETVGVSSQLFVGLPGNNQLYRRRDISLRSDLSDFPSVFSRPATQLSQLSGSDSSASNEIAPNLQMLTNALLLQNFTPAAVLTTKQGDIVYFSGKTGRFLEPASGKANLNLFAMARSGLNLALNEVFAKAIRQNTLLTMHDVLLPEDRTAPPISLTVCPLQEPLALRDLVLVVFAEDAASAQRLHNNLAVLSENVDTSLPPRMLALNQQLQLANAELLNCREEMQTSQEELKSANEELQSMNEELQSMNEELTTSREEMQSLNEEMQTVNGELQTKVNELSQSSDDMKNLLNSIEIATLFLDNELKVRRFTPQISSIFHLIPSDIGRPITDLVTSLEYASLARDAREVLETLMFSERLVAAHDGRWFTVRIMPYRTQDNRIDGVVITFVDNSLLRTLETAKERLAFAMRSTQMGLWDWDMAQGSISNDEVITQLLGFSMAELGTMSVETARRMIHPEDLSGFDQQLQTLNAANNDSFTSEHRMRHKLGHWVWGLWRGRVVTRTDNDNPAARIALRMVGSFQDISERKQAADALRLAQGKLNNPPRQ